MELVRGVLKLPLSGYAIDDRLREIGYGEWEGSTLAEMQAKDPDLFARRQAEKWTVAPPGGETYVSVQAQDDGLVSGTDAPTRSRSPTAAPRGR